MIKRTLLTVSFILLFASLASAQGRSEQIEINKLSEDNKYFIVFAARSDTSTGHAFVVWGVENAQTRQSSQKAFGLYPNAEGTLTNLGKAVFGSVPGQVLDDVLTGSTRNISNSLTVRVDSKQFADSQAVLDKFSQRADYSVIDSDCVTFVKEVGEALKLNMPARDLSTPGVWSPDSYISELIDVATKSSSLPSHGGTYTGQTFGGKPHGKGTLTTPEGHKYQGNFKEGLFDGKGISIFPDGSRYEGDFKNDQFEGKGIHVAADGSKYVGGFKKGKRDGKGTQYATTGTIVIEGEYKGGKLNGKGKIFFRNGLSLEADFRDNAAKVDPKDMKRVTEFETPNAKFSDEETRAIGLEGNATAISPDGSRYTGNFREGRAEGEGVLINADGDRYQGTFKNSLANGQGTYTFRYGAQYTGNFVDGKFNGIGTFKDANGEIYAGEFKENERTGNATLTLKNGDKYEGGFKQGRFDGDGTYTSANGVKFIGRYQNDKRHGPGRFVMPGGGSITAEFSYDELNGTAKFVTPGRGTAVAEFSHGELEGSFSHTYPDGTSYRSTYSAGKETSAGKYYRPDGTEIRPNTSGERRGSGDSGLIDRARTDSGRNIERPDPPRKDVMEMGGGGTRMVHTNREGRVTVIRDIQRAERPDRGGP